MSYKYHTNKAIKSCARTIPEFLGKENTCILTIILKMFLLISHYQSMSQKDSFLDSLRAIERDFKSGHFQLLFTLYVS